MFDSQRWGESAPSLARGGDTGGADGVGEEHGDGHGADAPGDLRDPSGDLGDACEVNVADEAPATFAGCVVDAVRADVDDGGARLHHLGGDGAGATGGNNEDVGGAGVGSEVGGAGVAEGDGGVRSDGFVREEDGEGAPDERGASDDDGVHPGGVDAGAGEEVHHAVGGAGDGAAGLATQEAAEVGGVEAVHVLCGVDGVEDGALVDVGGEGELLEDGVEAWVGIEAGDAPEEGVLGDAGGEADGLEKMPISAQASALAVT